MIHGWRVCVAALVLGACGGGAAEGGLSSGVLHAPVIYGTDGRIEALDYPHPTLVGATKELVGALLPRAFVARDGDGWLLRGPKLKDEVPLCAGEPFMDQPRLAVCTAILVRSNSIVTAGHCMVPELIADYVFVRGYYLGDTFPRIAADRVYEIEEVLWRVDGDLASESHRDMAIARLRAKRPLPAIDLSPRAEEPRLGESVIVVGTSEGLPIKIDDGGTVFAVSSSGYFEMTSDTFRGSSGSPVFAGDGQLLGMLVGGAADYQWDETFGCYRRLAFGFPAARGEIALSAEVLRRAVDSALAEVSTARDRPRCSAAAAGRGGANRWVPAAGVLIAAGVARRWRRRRRAAVRAAHRAAGT